MRRSQSTMALALAPALAPALARALTLTLALTLSRRATARRMCTASSPPCRRAGPARGLPIQREQEPPPPPPAGGSGNHRESLRGDWDVHREREGDSCSQGDSRPPDAHPNPNPNPNPSPNPNPNPNPNPSPKPSPKPSHSPTPAASRSFPIRCMRNASELGGLCAGTTM